MPIYTIVLIAAYAVVFFCEMGTNLDAAVTVAGFDKTAFLRSHEYWRILTGAALHASIIHILMNSYAFFSFGRLIEMLSNRAHLAIAILLSCLGGGILSLIFQPNGISVGASGGIVGLIGYLAVYAFKRRDFISAQFRRNLLINIGFILFYGVVLMSNIDNFAHIGGLITGAVYAFVQVSADPHIDPREASGATQTAGLVAVGGYIAICGFAVLLILRVI